MSHEFSVQLSTPTPKHTGRVQRLFSPWNAGLASLDVGFYQNNRMKATTYLDFGIRKYDIPYNGAKIREPLDVQTKSTAPPEALIKLITIARNDSRIE